jgi:hypothetical protein
MQDRRSSQQVAAWRLPVMKTVGVVAASWKLSVPGSGASMAAGLATAVPRQPWARPNTQSPAVWEQQHAWNDANRIAVGLAQADDEEAAASNSSTGSAHLA